MYDKYNILKQSFYPAESEFCGYHPSFTFPKKLRCRHRGVRESSDLGVLDRAPSSTGGPENDIQPSHAFTSTQSNIAPTVDFCATLLLYYAAMLLWKMTSSGTQSNIAPTWKWQIFSRRLNILLYVACSVGRLYLDTEAAACSSFCQATDMTSTSPEYD